MRLPRLSLLAQFTLLSLILTIVIGFALAYFLQDRLVYSTLGQEADSAADQVQLIVAPVLTAVDFDGIPASKATTLDSLIRTFIARSHIVRVKIWNKNGILLYSDDGSAIGKTFPISDELNEALGGQIAMEISALDKPENIGELSLGLERVFEIYVPVQPKDSPQILGAYEIYHDLDVLQPRIDSLRLYTYGSVGLGILILYLSLFTLVRGASRELVRRNEENARLAASEQRRANQLETVNEIGRQLTAILNPTQLPDEILHAITSRLGYDRASLNIIGDNKQIVTVKMRGFPNSIAAHPENLPPIYLGGAGLMGKATGIGKAVISSDVRADPQWVPFAPDDPTRSEMAIPLIARAKTIGVINIASNRVAAFDESDTALLETFAAQIAIAMDNARLYETTRRNLQNLDALRQIDAAISSTLELKQTLGILLQKATAHLAEGDAAAFVALVQPETETLAVAESRGLSQEFNRKFMLRIGESIAGQVAADGVPRIVVDLKADPRVKFTDLMEQERLASLLAVPMHAEGKIIGVLGLYARHRHDFVEEEINFFVTLGGQAAIAVQNAQLYERTKHQATSLAQLAQELEQSYDATLVAMSAALDARDRETEGHSRRVAALTVQLARALGIAAEPELRDIERGALLHDIGKIGVSDTILRKPGKLTAEEWIEMKKHPEIGAQMLRGIQFLERALPLVHYHQERWNGSGYPLGLQGEAIPLWARIFAVVDVYDALTSDRPYRAALPRAQAIAYLVDKRGVEFDPRVVDAFLQVVSG